MSKGGHGDVFLSDILNKQKGRPRDIHDAGRAEREAKKPRLTSSLDKENKGALRFGGGSKKGSSHDERHVRLHRQISAGEELALMEDLMAGIDASVFEKYELSSPIKPIRLQSKRIKQEHIKVKAERGSPPPDRSKPALVKTDQVSERKPVIPIEIKVESATKHVEVKAKLGTAEGSELRLEISEKAAVDLKQDEFEDELFEFDFDLADLSALDNDLLDQKAPVRSYDLTILRSRGWFSH
jgi:hypothetical protein